MRYPAVLGLYAIWAIKPKIGGVKAKVKAQKELVKAEKAKAKAIKAELKSLKSSAKANPNPTADSKTDPAASGRSGPGGVY